MRVRGKKEVELLLPPMPLELFLLLVPGAVGVPLTTNVDAKLVLQPENSKRHLIKVDRTGPQLLAVMVATGLKWCGYNGLFSFHFRSKPC